MHKKKKKKPNVICKIPTTDLRRTSTKMQHHNDKPVLVPAQDDSTSDEIISSQDAIESTINRYITLLTKKKQVSDW